MRIKQGVLASGLAAMVLLLSGCMSMEGDLTFDDQARADGELSIAINKQAASMAGIASLDAFEEAMTEDSDQESVVGGGEGEVSYSETDTDYVATATFQDVDLNGDSTWKAIINEDGQMEFAFVNEGMDTSELGGDDSDFGRVDLTIKFPGEVIEFSGEGATQIDETTIRWQFPFSQSNTIAATSSVGGMTAAPMLIGGAVLGLLCLGGAAAWALRRGNAGNSEQASPEEAPAAESHTGDAADEAETAAIQA